MPFPLNLEEMEQSGYTFLRSESCPDCLENVEVFLTPGKREIVMNPMCEALRPAVRHLEVCKPIPASKELLLKAGYALIERIVCPQCPRGVDMYDTPSGSSIILNPMMGGDWPVVGHRCNIAPKQESVVEKTQEISGPWRAVTDPNGQLLGVKYDPVDSIFRCRWKKGEGFHTGVPEEIFVTIQRVPFAYSYYQKKVKGQYPYTKVA